MELLGTIGSLVSLFAAVLFYFGWASTDAETRAFELRDSVFRLSTSDYLLRSVQALFLPAWLVVGALLAAVVLRAWLTKNPGRAESVVPRLRWSWLLPVGLLACYRLHPAFFELAIPLTAIPCLLATAYAHTRPGARPDAAEQRHRLHVWALTLVLCVLSLFWAVTSYAGIVGRGRAEEAARAVDTAAFPSVVVFSEKDLMIRGDGVCDQRVSGRGSAYGYRYSGLRLFHVSGDRIFLVGRDWSPAQGTLWTVRENEAVRVEYVSGVVGRREGCGG
ncbi:hypothetical protein [Streptomyces sp. RK9]|uniref:hypothetical protein n=1 Tax=Streptomyces sp. RK9 TaxID=3239284 RepID=UPI00386E6853